MIDIIKEPVDRAHFFNVAMSAEDSGEFFDAVLRHAPTSWHQAIIRHQEDEDRHVEMFRERITELGVKPYSIDPKYNLFTSLALSCGVPLDLEVEHPLMNAYLLLYVGEARASTQYGLLIPILRYFDDNKTAIMLEKILADEQRHVKICRAMAKEFAPTSELFDSELRRFQSIELETFTEFARAVLAREPWQT